MKTTEEKIIRAKIAKFSKELVKFEAKGFTGRDEVKDIKEALAEQYEKLGKLKTLTPVKYGKLYLRIL